VTTTAATLGPTAYWYLTRATGVVSLVLLTVSVVLGVLGPMRIAARPRWPRFAIDTLHRDCSLIVLVVIGLHIVTTVADGFAPITLLDGVIPFVSPYRPLWLGFGTFAFDLLLAVAITSLVRRRLGYKTWRAVHWLAYASWPIAVLHGLGTGTDTKAFWSLLLTAACVVAVAIAVWARLDRARPIYGGVREAALALTFATPVGLLIFTLAGPLQRGWAKAAGTPTKLLTSATTVRRVAVRTRPAAPTRAFSAQLAGSVSETSEPGGAIVDLLMHLSGGARGTLRVRLGGVPAEGGGLSMTGSQVDLLAAGLPFVLEGTVTQLQGQQFVAHVAGAGGTAFDLQASLQIDSANNTVTGSLQATPSGGA
jgi:DMSO/TMAO reductase YedYZ heme-binding membrane subunit